MSSSSRQKALEGGEADVGIDFGYSLEIDTKYDVGKEFRKPGYARGPEVRVASNFGDLPEGGYAKGSFGGARAVTKEGFSAQADGPRGYGGIGCDNDEAFVGGGGSIGDAEVHVGPFGLGVKGPVSEGKIQVGNKGLKIDGGVELASGNVQVGPVKVGAGVGMKGALRAGYDGVGAIVPGLGGAVVAEDGLELDVGPFYFKIGW